MDEKTTRMNPTVPPAGQGNPPQHPRLGVIGGGQLAKMTAMAGLQMGVDVVVLEKQPAEIESQRNPFLYQRCVPHPSNGHSACLTDSFDDFLKSKRSSKWRSTHRRKQRRLAEHGEVGFLVVKAQEEIDLRHRYPDDYSYVFFILRAAPST